MEIGIEKAMAVRKIVNIFFMEFIENIPQNLWKKTERKLIKKKRRNPTTK